MNKVIIRENNMHRYIRILCITFAMMLNITQTSCLGFDDFFGFKKVIEKNNNVIYIGLIKITGSIEAGQAEKVIQKLVTFSQDKRLKGILLVINSGGGEAGISELIFREVKSLSKKLPIVTLVMGMCCSGAYAIAVGSHWIVAPSAATIGSVGVLYMMGRSKNSRISTKEGVTADIDYELIKAGKYKALHAYENTPLTDEERTFIQAYVEADYKLFCARVAHERNLSLNSVTDWADGKIFNGNQALEKRLIDEVGGYSDAINALEKFIFGTEISIAYKINFIE